jgi:hypothetical protein
LEAQQIFCMRSLSSVSLIRKRYGFNFAASDLWKLARILRSRIASNVKRSVSGDFISC